jgi:hypothetical protein
MRNQNKPNGPIPGENFTSNTKNYPWHRPPDETDYVTIVNKSVKSLLGNVEKTSVALTALEQGDTIVDFVTGILRVMVGKGKLPIDMAVLAAGPIAKAVETIAEEAEIEFKRGWKQEPNILTSERIEASRSRKPKPEVPEETPVPTQEDNTGIMARGSGPAPKDVQSEMLGQSDEEEIQ